MHLVNYAEYNNVYTDILLSDMSMTLWLTFYK